MKCKSCESLLSLIEAILTSNRPDAVKISLIDDWNTFETRIGPLVTTAYWESRTDES